jgi:chromosome segregation ATPase
MSPVEIKQSKESELSKDIMRTQAVKSALERAQVELDNSEAKFNAMLAKQQARWEGANEEAIKKITDLQNEIKDLEKQREQINFPIEEEKKKAHDLFIQAEDTFKLARENITESEKIKANVGEIEQRLTEKLDELSDREQDVKNREDKATVRELACYSEREQIRQLSIELSDKLNKL